jgi:hypothetical protein
VSLLTIAMMHARGLAIQWLPIHVVPKFKKEHVHGATSNTVEYAKRSNAIGFESARLKLQRFAKIGMKAQIADRFLKMLRRSVISCLEGTDRLLGKVNAFYASHAVVPQRRSQTTVPDHS